MTTDLQTFNAVGLVAVSGNTVNVIMVAFPLSGRPVMRRASHKSERRLGFVGSALVAVNVGTETTAAFEIGKTSVMGHPEIEPVFQSAISLIKSAT